MSDPNAPDPIDKAYVQAEARLDDAAARAARRARVLGAVAAEPVAQPTPRPAWGRGGWLVAAGVAGVGLLLATQLYLPTATPPRTAPAPRVAAPAVQAVAPAVAPPAQAPLAQQPKAAEPLAARSPQAPSRKAAEAPPAETPAPQDRAAIAPPPPIAARAAAPAPPPPPMKTEPPAAAPPPAAEASSGSGINELVVTGEKRAAAPAPSAFAARSAQAVARLPKGRVGQPYPSTRVVYGGSPPYVVDPAAQAPPGLHVTPSGFLEGVPTRAGTEVLSIVVQDSAQPAQTLRGRYLLVIEP